MHQLKALRIIHVTLALKLDVTGSNSVESTQLKEELAQVTQLDALDALLSH